MDVEYPPEYLESLRLFNEGEFYECHDVLEELWAQTNGEEKRFYQGLIQAAVGLFHFGNGNLGGARKLYGTSRGYLEAYPDHYMGIDIGQLLADMQHCFSELLEAGDTYPEGVSLRDDRVPRITPPTSQAQLR